MATKKKYYKKKNIQYPKKETTNFDVTISTLDKNTTLITSTYDYYDNRVRTAMSEYSPDNKKYSVYLMKDKHHLIVLRCPKYQHGLLALKPLFLKYNK